MIIEMRTYRTKPGKRAEFLHMFRTRSMPKGTGLACASKTRPPFFFMRGFPDLESREPLKAKFYEGDL